MSNKSKFIILCNVLLSFNVYALHSENKNPEEELKKLAITRICEGLSQLQEVDHSLRNLVDQIDQFKPIKLDYYQKVRPTFQENYKLRKEIEDELEDLDQKERTTCTFIELHNGGPCARIENPELRAPINKKIAKYNKKSHELAPALERWVYECKSIKSQTNLVESAYKKARNVLEEGIRAVWEAVMLASLAEGSETLEGILKKPLTLDDEQLFFDCISRGLDLHMEEIIDDLKWSDQESSECVVRWYRENTQDKLSKITIFSSASCTRELFVPHLLENIISCKKFKS